MPDKNMELWNKVCRTDPEHTKHVNQRGGFTAIDAMYQIQEATKVFGPVGKGWGWDFELSYPSNDTVVAIVELWHTDRTYTVKQVGQKSLNNNRGSDAQLLLKSSVNIPNCTLNTSERSSGSIRFVFFNHNSCQSPRMIAPASDPPIYCDRSIAIECFSVFFVGF